MTFRVHRLLAVSFLVGVFWNSVLSEEIILQCPDDWVLSRGRCYLVYSESAEWLDAAHHCQRYGGNLAKVFGFGESYDISEVVAATDASITSFWIGLMVANETSAMWTSGQMGSTTEGFWTQYQPDSGSMCAYIDTEELYYYKQGSWSLTNCKQSMPFVCQTGGCPEGTIHCRNGRCIKKELCDGVDDCGDNTDEMECDANCAFHENGGDSGTISHERYGSFESCQWLIEGPVGTRLKMQFTTFGTEKDLDEVQVWVGGMSLGDSELVGRVSGVDYDNPLTELSAYYSPNNLAIVMMYSDVNNQDAGFVLDWSSEPFGSNDLTNLEATEVVQFLESPSYPEMLPPSCRNTWVITSRNWRVVTVQILDFDLGADDYVEFLDGEDLSAPVLARMDMDSMSHVITSTGSSIRIYLYTEQPVDKTGFRFSYIEGCVANILNATDGYVMSSGYGAVGYANFPECTWALTSGNGRPFTLRFEGEFGLEDGVDYLTVYDGSDDTGAELLKVTGTSLPGSLESTGDSIFIKMTANYIINGAGFNAAFSSGCDEPAFSAETEFSPDPLDVRLGQTITVTCPTGYFFGQEEHYQKDAVLLTCVIGGWNARMMPKCEPIYCGMVPLIENGYVGNSTGVQYADTVTYECYGGYGAVPGTETITCLEDGSWTEPPTCAAVSCPALTAPTDGQISLDNGDGTSYGSVVSVQCTTGYQILGAPTRYCTSTGWSGDEASCSILQCPPVDVEHGSNAGFTDYEGTVTITCDAGYVINGTNPMTCQLDQTYDGTPFCQDIDECEDKSDGCAQHCSNTVGSFTCSCDPGFEVNDLACQDIDECASVPCDHICKNSPTGSYTCECNAGFDLFTTDGTNGFNIPAGETGTLAGDTYRIDHTCVQKLCPVVSAPSDGVLLSAATTFYVGDEVYFQCNLGFVLIGQQMVTCGLDGQWDSSPPTCEAASCELPDLAGLAYPPTLNPSAGPIAYGDSVTVTCTHLRPAGSPLVRQRECVYDQVIDSYVLFMDDSLECPIIDCGQPEDVPGSEFTGLGDTVYGSKFTVTCKPRYLQMGGTGHADNDNTVECTGDGYWQIGTILCEGETCQDPGTPAGGTQDATTYEEGATVSFECDRSGFEPSEPYALECIVSGTSVDWNSTTVPDCVDAEPPVFDGCPDDRIVINKLDSPEYSVPTVTDNSGSIFSLILTVDPDNFNPEFQLKDDLTVTYSATDLAGNTASCVVSIHIKDDKVPIITCPESITHLVSTDAPEVLEFPADIAATATDNLGEASISYDPPSLTIDSSNVGQSFIVTANATDSDDNWQSCRFMVHVEADVCTPWGLREPQHGQMTCNPKPGDAGWDCDIVCDADHLLYEPLGASITTLSCNTGEQFADAVDCLPVTEAPYHFKIQAVYITEPASEIDWPACESTYRSQMEVGMQTVATSLTDFATGNFELIYGPVIIESVITEDTLFLEEGNGTYANITFTYAISPDSLTDSAKESIMTVLFAIVKSSGTIAAEIVTLEGSASCPTIATAESEMELRMGDFSCLQPTFLHAASDNNKCVPCPYGNYYDDGACVPCAVGTYQDEVLQYSCKNCSADSWTYGTGSISPQHCEATCFTFDMVSSTGLPPCDECGQDSYASNATTCDDCPLSTKTHGPGKADPAECKEACSAGLYSPSGYTPCEKCPLHFYQDSIGESHCVECDSHKITLEEGSTDYPTDCIDGAAVLCAAGTCENGGDCSIVQHTVRCTCVPGFTGSRCESEIDYCESNPCYNGGTCEKQTNGYNCECLPDYSGDHCEFDPPNCAADICQNGGMCQDLVDDFKCLCLAGLTGDLCEEFEQVCDASPCDHGGVCSQLNIIRRTCSCADGYSGTDCEIDIDECSSNPCLFGGKCVDGVNGYKCECVGDLTGSDCETRPDVCGTDPCSGTGGCLDDYTTNSVVCVCDTGFERDAASTAGLWMATIVDVSVGTCSTTDFCATSPCENGQCSQGTSSFTCQCDPGFAGLTCQHNIDDCQAAPCQNGAKCMDKVEGYFCECLTGFEGLNCEDNINDCACSTLGTDTGRPNGGCEDLVDDFRCHCWPGYTGNDCSEDIDECASSPCLHDGTCQNGVGEFTCDCVVGWTGDRCETLEDGCESTPCVAPSTCHPIFGDYFCQCDGRTYGKECDLESSTCRDASPCVADDSTCLEDDTGNATCRCSPEHIGVGCEIVVDFCAGGGICQNGGTCISEFGDFRCLCDFDFVGDYCEISRDDCATVTCQAGGNCVDGIGVHYCECPLRKTGTNCAKDIDTDFDMCIDSATNTGMAAQAYPFVFELTTFTLGMWVKYDNPDGEGTFFTLFGMSNRNIKAQKEEIIRIDHENVYITMHGVTLKEGFNLYDINDIKWYYINIMWDGLSGIVQVRVNSVEVSAFDFSASAGEPLPLYGWIVLGSQYDPVTESTVEGMGFKGMVSQLNMWNRLLTTSDELPLMALNRDNLVESGLFLRWKNFQIYSGSRMCRPSTAGDPVCPVGFTDYPACTTKTKVANPVTISCPEVVWQFGPERVTQVSWEDPQTTGLVTGTPRSTYLNDRVFIWGKYTNIYTAEDEDENEAVCVFDIYVRFQSCDEPEMDTGNDVDDTCDADIFPFRTCTPECTQSNEAMPVRTPNFYTCGPQGSFNVWDFYLPFTYPYCSSAAPAKVKELISATYTGLPIDCTRLDDIKAFEGKSRELIEFDLNAKWGNSAGETTGGFCNGDCASNLVIETTCQDNPDGGVDVTLDFVINNLADTLYDATGLSLTAEQILINAILDDNGLNFDPEIPEAFVNMDTVTLDTEPFCGDGQSLNAGLCVDCNKGNYYDAATQTCVLCQKAEYQDLTKETSCKPCPGGLTTKREGATSSSECKLICGLGKYNDGDDNCVECAMGFYQDEDDQFYCKPCDADKTTTLEGTEREEDCKELCPDGTQLATDTTCEDCVRGTYRTVGIEAFCVQCPEGWTTPGNRSRNIDDCSIPDCVAGYYITGRNCTKCERGRYQPESWQYDCLPCEDGLTTAEEGSTAEDQCQFYCPEGQEEHPLGPGTCRLCLVETYKDNDTPGERCEPCPAGHIAAEEGATHEDNCTIRACQKGEQPTADLQDCELCPLGTYNPIDKPTGPCTVCPNGDSTVRRGAVSEAECAAICPSGQEKDADGASCILCEIGYYKDNTEDELGSCQLCPTDFVTPTVESTSKDNCTVANCTLGEYVDANNVCQPCEIGQYQDERWQDSCKPCPGTTTTDDKGSDQQSDCRVICEAGFEDQNNDDSCTECEIGFYKDTRGSALCTECPDDTVTEIRGATSESDCNVVKCLAGNYRNAAEDKCYPCDTGSYQHRDYQTECIDCSTGLTTLGPGKAAEADCVTDCPNGQGYDLDQGKCVVCPRDMYRTKGEQHTCTLCPNNKIGLKPSLQPNGNTRASECIIANCSAGYKTVGDAPSTCEECPRGQYQDEQWQESCDTCTSGTTTEFTASTSQSDCKKDCGDGSELNDANNKCEPCELNFYKTASQSFRCVACPSGLPITDDTGSTSVDNCRSDNCTTLGGDAFCQNGGTCLRGSCICADNYHGSRCELRDTPDTMVPYIIGGTIGATTFLLLTMLAVGLCSWCMRSPYTTMLMPVGQNPNYGGSAGSLSSSPYRYFEDNDGPVKNTRGLGSKGFEERVSTMNIN